MSVYIIEKFNNESVKVFLYMVEGICFLFFIVGGILMFLLFFISSVQYQLSFISPTSPQLHLGLNVLLYMTKGFFWFTLCGLFFLLDWSITRLLKTKKELM